MSAPHQQHPRSPLQADRTTLGTSRRPQTPSTSTRSPAVTTPDTSFAASPFAPPSLRFAPEGSKTPSSPFRAGLANFPDLGGSVGTPRARRNSQLAAFEDGGPVLFHQGISASLSEDDNWLRRLPGPSSSRPYGVVSDPEELADFFGRASVK